MDLATLIGLLAAIGIIAASIFLGGSAGTFFNVPSLLVVVGGTIGAVLMQFSIGQFFGAVKVALKAFFNKGQAPEELIETTIDMANSARKGGLLALEEKDTGNPFFQMGIQMMVDGHEPDVVRQMMTSEMTLTVERHDLGQKIFKSIAEVAPAMGMIGTLIGLVQMLSNMDDPKSIGPSMAVALLTTLYGAMIANVFAGPIAEKLGLRSNEERLVKSMIIDGVSGIQEGRNPRVIEGMLMTYLPGSKRKSAEDAEAA
ncbi:MAG: flagellar motor protein PomA [Gammaproteobacteria bacterium]|nr:flagellar motor protein PomA [Gammaproteobacteria bacterium]